MAFKMKGYSAFTQTDKPVGEKKTTEHSGLFGNIKKFTKGARTSTGTYTPDDVTVEKGKKTIYVPQGGTTKKVIQKKKKGSVSGASAWVTKRSKDISTKKAEKQIKRKQKKYK